MSTGSVEGPLLICATVIAVRTSVVGSGARSMLNSLAGLLLLIAIAGAGVIFDPGLSQLGV